MSNTEEPPLFRILCLHDENSSALALSKQLKRLDRQLRNHAVELCFLNSPLLHSSNDNNGGFVWWENNDDTVEPQYVGLDATLLHVKQVLACTPFVAGILAVGKGAALLPFLINDDLEFAILVHGKSILEEQERLVDEDWPVLHIVDPDFDSSQHFIDQFGGQVHECTSRFDVSALNAIGKFVVQQKKQLISKCSEELVLQNQLVAVEQEAALLVAQHAMERPPSSLVAAIVPNATSQQHVVGAWNGSKPFKAGGGAPCPSEFLLSKQKRQGHDYENDEAPESKETPCDDR